MHLIIDYSLQQTRRKLPLPLNKFSRASRRTYLSSHYASSHNECHMQPCKLLHRFLRTVISIQFFAPMGFLPIICASPWGTGLTRFFTPSLMHVAVYNNVTTHYLLYPSCSKSTIWRLLFIPFSLLYQITHPHPQLLKLYFKNALVLSYSRVPVSTTFATPPHHLFV